MTHRIGTYVTLAVLVLVALAPVAQAESAKNVILMVSDGIGFNGWEAAKYYQGGLPYDNSDFKFYGMTHWMLNTRDASGNLIDVYADTKSAGGLKQAATAEYPGLTTEEQGYDPAQMWSDFNYSRGNHKSDYFKFTGSAASATALYTGEKTYRGGIAMDVDGNPIKTLAEIAAEKGKATGSISSVQYNHATPGTVDAHWYSRDGYGEIASDMLSSDLDVIMGGDSRTPGTQVYTDAANAGFTVVSDDDLNDWDDLADGDGTFQGGAMPTKVFGGFGGATLDGREKPTLETMTKAALNILSQDPDGMHLMVEGGAIDWQNHANNADLMMREQVDFDNSVQAVMDWVEANGGWEENLLIITSDHETGGIWGPNTVLDDNGTPNDFTDDTINSDWQNVVDNGEGNMPGVQYTSGGHTNALVPLWARGAGADLFDTLVDGTDAQAAAFWTQFGEGEWDGSYVDNTDVFGVMNQVVPEPATMTLLALGGLGVLVRRRRR